MSISQNEFLQEVAYHLDLPLDHPLYEGLTGIPKIEKPDLSEGVGRFDYASHSIIGTPCDNDYHYVKLQVYELFRKADFTLEGVDPHENAVKAFLGQLQRSDENNRRLKAVLGMPDSSPIWDNKEYVAFRKLLVMARSYCHVLTDHAVAAIKYKGIEPRFTSGACQGSKVNLPTGNSPVERFSNAVVSKDVAPFFNEVVDSQMARQNDFIKTLRFHVVESGWSVIPQPVRFQVPFWMLFWNRAHVRDKVTLANFVNKTYMIQRPTFKECVGDIALQCGIGDILAESLAFNGYDVSTLPDLHKQLAELGSVTGNIATFDMKGGSENVYTALGEYMLHEDIYEVCSRARTRQVDVDGIRYEYPNMATAGNGFCFPLETIIFLSLQMAVCAYNGLKPRVRRVKRMRTSIRRIEKNGYHNLCSTFGDDVIIPTSFSPMFIEFFSKLGIVLNLDKSFYSGTFRESCGGHFDNGRDINCFNMKTVPTMGNTNEIKKFLNGIRRFGYDNNRSVWRHPNLRDLWYGILGTSFGKPDDRARSPALIVNHGENGDSGVLVPRTYTTTRYVHTCRAPFLTAFLQKRGSRHLGLRMVTNTVSRESYRLYKIRSVAAAGGYPIVSQKFYATRFATKISLPKLLRENPLPSLPLLKIVGQGLLSGAGLVHPLPGDYQEVGNSVSVGTKDDVLSRYPEFFVRDRLEIVNYTVEADPSAFSNEEVDELFLRIGHNFERTRIARISRDALKRRRLNVWETRRSMIHKQLLSLLEVRRANLETEVLQLFS